MGDRTLYLHIGCHKTGSTSIQQTLRHNQHALEEQGMHFFYRNYKTGKNLLPDLHSWLGFDINKGLIPSGMHIRDAARLAKELSELNGDVIVSSENFSFVFDANQIKGLQESLSQAFQNIKIICYVRRQDQQVVSHHQEGAKLMRDAEYDLFGHSAVAIPVYEPKHALYLDYNQRLSMWGDAFGDENLIIRVFDRSELKDGDVVADFFDILGVATFQEVDEKNVSLGLNEAKLGHLINASAVGNKTWMVDLLRPRMTSSAKMLPSRSEARAYYKNYVKSNRLLNKRFKISERGAIFNQDFSMYPKERTDLWCEESANNVITHMLEAVDEVYGALSAAELRDAAVALEKSMPELSLKLMTVAYKLRPKGVFISKKLKEYRQRLEEKSEE